MHNLYELQSVLEALKNLFWLCGDGLAVVSVLCLVSALRGPLFQRASMVDGNAVRRTVGKHELKIAQLIPPEIVPTDQILQPDLEFPHILCSSPGLLIPLGSDCTLSLVVHGRIQRRDGHIYKWQRRWAVRWP